MSAITTGPGIKLQGEIVLWRSLASRSIFALWMLEELGLPFRSEVVGRPRPAALLKIEPSGRVPVLVAEGEAVSEAPAICLFLADRYGEERLGPGPGEKGRGAFLKWIVWSTAVLEPARELAETQIAPRRNGWGPGWPALDLALEDLVARPSPPPT
ncbi:MAG: glutathione S-transferase family protein [Caulobacteraceae bacterium]